MLVDIDIAADLINHNQLVAIPTETVYGLAARYDSEKAIEKVYKLKNRPLDHPLIIHIGATQWLYSLTQNCPDYINKLIEAFWPGPLTLVLPKSKLVSPLITAGQSTVALRMPNHPTCLELLSQLESPIVAPSANPYCRISPTSPAHVLKYFTNALPILNGGPCKFGIESTIILATNESNIQILRPGLITEEMIEDVAKIKCIKKNKEIKISGNKEKHYAPTVPLIPFSNIAEVEKYINDDKQNYLFILLSDSSTGHHDVKRMKKKPSLYSSELYAIWHEAEEKQYDAVFIEKPKNHEIWRGIIDRINKASSDYF